MKTCPFCAEEIQDAAVVCKHCQRSLLAPPSATTAIAAPSKKRGVIARILRFALFVAIGLVGFVLLLVFLANNTADITTPTSGIDATKARALVDQAVQAGYITEWTCTGNTARVAPAFWVNIEAKEKEGLVLALARVCDAASSGNRMTIYDSRSGRELADYGGRAVSFK